MSELEPFPVHSLVPKRETGAERLLSRFRQYDGRGVVIAIFDTGVDPGAPGLSETTLGDRKILDLVDATGSGDVDTSTVHITEGDEGRQIKGLSGRALMVPDEWNNPTGQWHVGIKAAFELFPSAVKSRLQSKYMTKEWQPKQDKLMAEAVRKLVEFEASHPASDLNLSDQFELDNMKATVDVLTQLQSKDSSLAGPVYDCVVFHDGHSWSAVVDTTEKGTLSGCQLLKPFNESGQFSKFGEFDQVNYSISVYEEGNVLCIVTTGGSHGTHVASIAAAHFPDNPEKDGVAPGAQIVSVKIGDTRLSTMETSASLIRAAIVAAELKVDMVNFSYGECSHWTNSGAVMEEFIKLVDKHNIVFVSSAGNNGPALSTVGCPGGNTSSLIGVGAFVSPDMMSGEYSLTHKKPGLPYTWSSRGPSVDGDLGVTITAPGGAITSVPNWTLQNRQLMNGTSMSSPNVCGCIALMISALKAQGVPYSPAAIKQSLSNTAVPLGSHDPFSVGHGVIQIDKAYELYLENQDSPINNVRFVVSLAIDKNARGIYIREAHQLKQLIRTSVSVEATFHEDIAPSEKLKFELEVALVSSCPWVTAPNHICMWTGSRQFVIEVDPRGLESGAHYAEVCAYDVSGKFKGILFKIPVTVIVPHKLTDEKNSTYSVPALELKRSDIYRSFFHVSHSMSWATLKVSNTSTGVRSRVTVQTVQLLPEQSFRENESYTTLTLPPGNQEQVIIPLVGGATLEVCLTPYWSDVRDASLSLSIVFHSLQPSTQDLTFHSGLMWTSLNVVSSIGQEDFSPEFKLTHHVVAKRPSENSIKPLGSRDILSDGRQVYELVLTYNFHMNRATEVRPNLYLLSTMLYECPYGGQFWMLYDSNKQLLGSGDAYAKNYCVKVDKGDYVIRVQVRHQNKSQLDHLKDMIILLEFKLPSTISLDVGPSRRDTLTSSCKYSPKSISCGKMMPVYISALSSDKLSKVPNLNSGDILVGKFTLSKDETVKKKVSYQLQYVVGPKATPKLKKQVKGGAESTNSVKSSGDGYAAAEKEFKLQWIKSLPVEELEMEYGDDVDFLFAKLKRAQENKECQYNSIRQLTSTLLSKLDQDKVLAHVGTKLHLDQNSTAKSREVEKIKNMLVETLLIEADVLMRGDTAKCVEDTSSSHSLHPRLQEIYIELCKFVDAKDPSLRSFLRKFAEHRGHTATAIKILMEETSDKMPSKDLYTKYIEYLECLHWDHCAQNRRQWSLRKYPDNYQPF